MNVIKWIYQSTFMSTLNREHNIWQCKYLNVHLVRNKYFRYPLKLCSLIGYYTFPSAKLCCPKKILNCTCNISLKVNLWESTSRSVQCTWILLGITISAYSFCSHKSIQSDKSHNDWICKTRLSTRVSKFIILRFDAETDLMETMRTC